MTLDTLYNINQYVTMVDLQSKARVIAIKLEGKNLLYQLEYWNNGVLLNVWQDEDQIKA